MICAKCNKEFPRYITINRSIKNLSSRKFCLECSPFGMHNTRPILDAKEKLCLHCGNILEKHQELFCDNNCKSEYYYEEYIKRWKQGLENGMRGKYGISTRIKRYLFKKFDNKCSKCGWGEKNSFTGNIPLEVHHKDGDYTNNDEENLDLLCPNCHSLTDTYKNINTNNGRKERSKYSI